MLTMENLMLLLREIFTPSANQRNFESFSKCKLLYQNYYIISFS